MINSVHGKLRYSQSQNSVEKGRRTTKHKNGVMVKHLFNEKLRISLRDKKSAY